MMNPKHALAAVAAAAMMSAPAFAQMVVNVGTEPAFAPFEYVNDKSKDKEIIGFDIDMIRAIGEKEGFSVKLYPMQFDGLIPAVLTGTIDAAVAGITITDERKKKVDFSDPYYNAGLGIIINDKVKDSVKSAADLKGHRLCSQIGTSGAMYASKVPDSTLITFNTPPESYMELKNGGCDAAINDYPVHAFFMETSKPEGLTLLPDRLTSEQYGIMLSKQKPEIAKMINDGLAKIKQDGSFDKIYRKWFGDAAE
ncbi:MAG: basic amino acid ABC transporter substrate-binding protein [Succinivibrio sp.]